MIEDLKVLLGLPEEIDEELENKLLLILKATKQRLRFLLGGLEPPEEMNYIILDMPGYHPYIPQNHSPTKKDFLPQHCERKALPNRFC